MKGVITAIIRRREGQNGGYGFLRDEQNQERFFHARNLRDLKGAVVPGLFEKLLEGTAVEFVPVTDGSRGNGLRAEHVVIDAQ